MTALEVRNLHVCYGQGKRRATAVEDVSFLIPNAGVLGLVGESGSGKSTVARAIVGLVPVASGQVLLDGVPIDRRRMAGNRISMVFQDPYASLNPRITIADALREVVKVTGAMPRSDRAAEVARLLDLVHLTGAQGSRYPAQLSGGQRQRAAIARALASRPAILVADEITSSLDVSVQASVLNVMREVIERTRVTTLFISHNLAVVRYISQRVAVMHCAQIVEYADNRELFAQPQHPYTSVLISSVPSMTPGGGRVESGVDGEPPDPHAPPSGCRFHPRCPQGPAVRPERTVCTLLDPAVDAAGRVHSAACHFAHARTEPVRPKSPQPQR